MVAGGGAGRLTRWAMGRMVFHGLLAFRAPPGRCRGLRSSILEDTRAARWHMGSTAGYYRSLINHYSAKIAGLQTVNNPPPM